MTYSPFILVINKGRARRGVMEAEIDGRMQLSDWDFLPDNEWSSDINLEKVPMEGLQQLAGWKYPVKGLVTGQFHGRGTKRAAGADRVARCGRWRSVWRYVQSLARPTERHAG